MFQTKRHSKLQKATAALSKRSWAELHGSTHTSRHYGGLIDYITTQSIVTRARRRYFLG